jgi:O-succinylhomoserine sulfhydrylase
MGCNSTIIINHNKSGMQQNKFTQAIRFQTERPPEMNHSTPMFLTSSICFNDAESMRDAVADETDDNIYSRFSNPNVQELIDKVCVLEGAEAGYATASGMSAVFGSFMALLKQGDHLLACNSIFGSTHTVITKYLNRYGIAYSYISATATEHEWAAAIQPNTKMIYVETPTNPGLDILDLKMLGKLAKQNGIILTVDNCFATPLVQQPILLGADLVIHSATKWMDGQGRVLGGVTVGRIDLIKEIYAFCRSTGPALSPFNAWVLSKSLETLEVRMERHCSNAIYLANALQHNNIIAFLKYPFLPTHPQYAIAQQQMQNGGGIICFELKGGLESGRNFINALQMLS